MAETQGQASQGIGGKLKELGVTLANNDRSKSVDIRAIVSDITIYENIFNQTLHGVLTVIDAVGLLSGYGPFAILGEEHLTFTYSIHDEEKPHRQLEFFVHGISPVLNAENLKHKRYMLSFGSEEHVLDAARTVQHAYNQPLSEIVKAIVSEYLDSKKKVDVQETKGVQKIVIPNISPLEAIDMCRRRSIAAEKYTSGSYLFYETTEGFVFSDIENLVVKGREKLASKKETYTYAISQGDLQRSSEEGSDSSPDDPRNYNRQEFKTLFAFAQAHKSDTIEKIKLGMFNTQTMTFDPVKVSFSKSSFKFDPKKTITLGSNAENSKAFIDQMKDEKNVTKSFFVTKDSSVPDTYIDELIPNRASYMSRFAQNMFTANIIGDPLLMAGDVINVPNIPAYRDPDGLGNTDQILSGEFLIAGIVHKFGQETYVAELELYKNGYAKDVEDTINQE